MVLLTKGAAAFIADLRSQVASQHVLRLVRAVSDGYLLTTGEQLTGDEPAEYDGLVLVYISADISADLAASSLVCHRGSAELQLVARRPQQYPFGPVLEPVSVSLLDL